MIEAQGHLEALFLAAQHGGPDKVLLLTDGTARGESTGACWVGDCIVACAVNKAGNCDMLLIADIATNMQRRRDHARLLDRPAFARSALWSNYADTTCFGCKHRVHKHP